MKINFKITRQEEFLISNVFLLFFCFLRGFFAFCFHMFCELKRGKKNIHNEQLWICVYKWQSSPSDHFTCKNWLTRDNEQRRIYMMEQSPDFSKPRFTGDIRRSNLTSCRCDLTWNSISGSTIASLGWSLGTSDCKSTLFESNLLTESRLLFSFCSFTLLFEIKFLLDKRFCASDDSTIFSFLLPPAGAPLDSGRELFSSSTSRECSSAPFGDETISSDVSSNTAFSSCAGWNGAFGEFVYASSEGLEQIIVALVLNESIWELSKVSN